VSQEWEALYVWPRLVPSPSWIQPSPPTALQSTLLPPSARSPHCNSRLTLVVVHRSGGDIELLSGTPSVLVVRSTFSRSFVQLGIGLVLHANMDGGNITLRDTVMRDGSCAYVCGCTRAVCVVAWH